MSNVGKKNAYYCADCEQYTVTIDVDDGVTPMFLGCRAGAKCEGRASSMGYPAEPWPKNVPNVPKWEWYKPTGKQLAKLTPATREHVGMGGLDLRKRAPEHTTAKADDLIAGEWPLTIYGHPALRTICNEIGAHALEHDAAVYESMARSMVHTMQLRAGIGLAANQVAFLARMCVIAAPGKKPTVLINPRIVESSDEKLTDNEGCLSIPGWLHQVCRPAEVTVEALDVAGNQLTFDATGLEARIVGHELDHLQGRLIVDNGTRQQKRAFQRWWRPRSLGLATDEQLTELVGGQR